VIGASQADLLPTMVGGWVNFGCGDHRPGNRLTSVVVCDDMMVCASRECSGLVGEDKLGPEQHRLLPRPVRLDSWSAAISATSSPSLASRSNAASPVVGESAVTTR
jgi:hypothetical protein